MNLPAYHCMPQLRNIGDLEDLRGAFVLIYIWQVLCNFVQDLHANSVQTIVKFQKFGRPACSCEMAVQKLDASALTVTHRRFALGFFRCLAGNVDCPLPCKILLKQLQCVDRANLSKDVWDLTDIDRL
jgi:hypothetical protein